MLEVQSICRQFAAQIFKIEKKYKKGLNAVNILCVNPFFACKTFKHGILSPAALDKTAARKGETIDFLKNILNEELYAQIETAINAHNRNEANKDKQVKLANLASGKYVGKGER